MSKEPVKPVDKNAAAKPKVPHKNVDRPGFDLGGATGENEAGRGLGLGTDAKDNRKGQRLPR